MFCPKCGAEYVEDITVCSKCNAPLVAQPPDGIEPGFIKFVTVYKTGDPAFIAFAKSILQSEGIQYYFKGEGIQDLFAGGRLGTGFNPAIGPVQIQVDEKDVEKAKELLKQIEEGEFEQLETDVKDEHLDKSEDHAPKRNTFKNLLKGIVIGILISAMAFYVYYYREKRFSGVLKDDRNKDSKPDLIYTYKNGAVVMVEEDRNFDGKIDLWLFYKDGSEDRSVSDDDFDGRFDTTFYYKNGVLIRSEIDTNVHNRPKIIEEYKNGVLDRIEIDTNFDDKPEIIEEYRAGVLSAQSWYHELSRSLWKKAYFVGGVKKEEYIDQDYDGTLDIKIIYDLSERPIKTVSLH
jgi:antitoxin component YwqK of YwqJK toxin-antitoxin module